MSGDVVIIFFINIVRRGTLGLNKPLTNKQTFYDAAVWFFDKTLVPMCGFDSGPQKRK